MTTDQDVLMEQARMALEVGRARAALLHAALLATATALFGTWLVDAHAWAWAPLTFALWSFVWWRGDVLLKGARYGLFAGALTFLFPMSLLRPCCRLAMDGKATCTMPEMCVLAGAIVGLPLALLVLRRSGGRNLQAALGMALGVLSLATIKCSALFVGEALGLIGGLGVGIAMATVVSGWSPRLAR